MQALQIYLNQQPAIRSEQGANVQGMNAPIRDEYSFDSYLQKEASEQTSKAKEGPPENQSSPSLDTAPVSEKSKTEQASKTNENTQTDRLSKTDDGFENNKAEELSKSNENFQLEKVSKTDDGFENKKAKKIDGSADTIELPTFFEKTHEGDVLLDTIKKKEKITQDKVIDTLQVPSDVVKADVLFDANEILPSAKTASLITDESANDKKLDANAVVTDDVILAALGLGNLSGIEQMAVKSSVVKNSDETNNFDIDSVGTNKKGRHVLAEIPTINVQDERTVTTEGKTEGSFVRSIDYDGNGTATIDMSLNQNGANLQNTPGTILNADGSVQQHTTTNAQQFGTMLSSEIQSNSSELVKTGSIVLKDGNQGTINLILHPEELGNVKIRLEISDNILTGRIMVESEEAFYAFKENLASLREAFTESGFDTAGFDLSWSGQKKDEAEQDQAGQKTNLFGNRYDDNIATIPDGVEMEYNSTSSRAYVNVMA